MDVQRDNVQRGLLHINLIQVHNTTNQILIRRFSFNCVFFKGTMCPFIILILFNSQFILYVKSSVMEDLSNFHQPFTPPITPTFLVPLDPRLFTPSDIIYIPSDIIYIPRYFYHLQRGKREQTTGPKFHKMFQYFPKFWNFVWN